MRFDGISVAAAVCVLPPHTMSSAQMETRLAPVYERLRLPEGRLELMTGIRERRQWEPGTRPSTVAAQAGAKAIETADIDPARIGCLVHASVCRDFQEPATASVVHEHLSLPDTCSIFDLSNACLGVLNGMAVVATMIQAGQIDAGLVVSGEVSEPLHEATMQQILADDTLTRQSFKKHFASLTIGSGAAAVLLTRSDLTASTRQLLGAAVLTDSASNKLCREDVDAPTSADGPLMSTDAEALLHAGCALAGRTWNVLKEELAWSNETPRHAFTHQVGSAHRKLLFETIGVDPSIDAPTVETLGNTGSAALPTALALGLENKKINAGDPIALLGIGSGLSCMMMGMVG